jgi:hypothetical protein
VLCRSWTFGPRGRGTECVTEFIAHAGTVVAVLKPDVTAKTRSAVMEEHEQAEEKLENVRSPAGRSRSSVVGSGS